MNAAHPDRAQTRPDQTQPDQTQPDQTQPDQSQPDRASMQSQSRTGTSESPAGGVRRRPVRDAGMATAEYAIATLAACGFAGLLVAILRGDEVRSMLVGIIRRALSLG